MVGLFFFVLILSSVASFARRRHRIDGWDSCVLHYLLVTILLFSSPGYYSTSTSLVTRCSCHLHFFLILGVNEWPHNIDWLGQFAK